MKGTMKLAMTALNRADMIDCMQCGEVRTAASTNRRDNWGLKNDDPVEDARRQTVGYLGEMAVARYFGQEMQRAVNVFKLPDVFVGKYGLQVKASEWAKNLIIRPDAKDHEPYILVRVEMPKGDPRDWETTLPAKATAKAVIMGWMLPYEARLLADSDPSLHRDPGGRSPAIFIPSHLLTPIEKLKRLTDTQTFLYNLEGSSDETGKDQRGSGGR
jgi:hypothetical protein